MRTGELPYLIAAFGLWLFGVKMVFYRIKKWRQSKR